MRRLFLVLDLSLLRHPEEETRAVVLQQLVTAVGRLWAAYQPDGQGGSASGGSGAARHVSWGYALYDSACPDLLLKPKLRRIAQSLRLPVAFQETINTDCRGSDLVHFTSLVDTATQPAPPAAAAAAAAAGAGPTVDSGSGETPAAALARALQSSLCSTFLRKLQEIAEDDSSSGASHGGGSSKAEGLMVLFSPGLSTAAQLQAFLGSPSGQQAETLTSQQAEAAAQQLMAAALPTLLWQRCTGSGLRVCWVAPDAAAGSSSEEQQIPVLSSLHALMQQRCMQASAAPLAELAGPYNQAQFAARMALPCGAAAAVEKPPPKRQKRQEGEEEEGEEEGDCWPAAVGPEEDAMENLKLLLANLEGHREREAEEARQRLRAQHRQLTKQRQHAMLPGAARRPPAPVANKGKLLLKNAERLAADKGRKGGGSQPTSARLTPEDAATFSDDQHNLLAAAAAGLGEEDEVESGAGMAPEAAAADLKERLDALLASITDAEQPPTPAAMLQQIRSMVEGCFASMHRYYLKCDQQQQKQQQQAAGALVAEPAAGAGDEATSAPMEGIEATTSAEQPMPPQPAVRLGLDGMRALLLQRVPVALADLRRLHQTAEDSATLRQVARRLLAELLLRLCICAYGARPGHLPSGQYAEVEVLMQCVVATLQPIPEAGQDVFKEVIKKHFGTRFPSDMRRLQSELWDDDLSLDFDSMLGEMRAKVVDQEESGETPGCSSGPLPSGPAKHLRTQRQSSSLLTGGRSGAVGFAGAAAGPSNLGRVQREASGREGTSGRPSAGTARASTSVLSGEHSGVHGGTSGATGATGATGTLARSGSAAALTATSRSALTNLSHIRHRYNNTKQFDLQVRSKVPTSLMPKSKLKQHNAMANSRPAAGGGSSRAAAAMAAARGLGGGAPPVPPRQQRQAPRQQRQIPATPDSNLKLIQAAQQAAQRATLAQQQQQQQVPASILSGGCGVSHILTSPVPGAAAAAAAGAGLEAIPDTDARPRLPLPPTQVAAAGAAAGRLLRSPSHRHLDFNLPAALPGAILPTQPLGLDGGSANVSPAGGASAPVAAPAGGPTWLMAATVTAHGGRKRARPAPAVEPAAPAAAAEGAAEPETAMGPPSAELESGNPGALPPAAEPAAAAEAQPEAEAEAQPFSAITSDRRRSRASTQAEPAAEAAEPPSGPRRGRSQSRPARAAAVPDAAAEAAAEGAAAVRRGRSRSRPAPATEAATAKPEAEVEVEAASAGRRGRSRSRAAASAQPAAVAAADPEGEAAAEGAAAGQRGRIRQRPEEATPAAPPPDSRPANRSAAAVQTPTDKQTQEAPAAEGPPPSSRRTTRRTAAHDGWFDQYRPAKGAGTPAADQEQQQIPQGDAAADEPAPASRRATRHTPASQAARDAEPAATSAKGRRSTRLARAEKQQPDQESQPDEAPAPRRQSNRHAPEGAAAPATAPEPGPAGRRSKKRHAGQEGQQRDPASTAEQQQLLAGAQMAASAAQLTHIAGMLGCRRCPGSRSGCLSCRPKVAAALAQVGLQGLMLSVGQCGNGKCYASPRGCSECWASVKHLLLNPGEAATAPAAALAAAPLVATGGAGAEAQPTVAAAHAGSTPAGAGGAMATQAGSEPASKRRNTGRASSVAATAAAASTAPELQREQQQTQPVHAALPLPPPEILNLFCGAGEEQLGAPQQQGQGGEPAVAGEAAAAAAQPGADKADAQGPAAVADVGPQATGKQLRSRRSSVGVAAQGDGPPSKRSKRQSSGKRELQAGFSAGAPEPTPSTALRRGRSAGLLHQPELAAAEAQAQPTAISQRRRGRSASKEQQDGTSAAMAQAGAEVRAGAAQSRSRSRSKAAAAEAAGAADAGAPTLSQAAAAAVEAAVAEAAAAIAQPVELAEAEPSADVETEVKVEGGALLLAAAPSAEAAGKPVVAPAVAEEGAATEQALPLLAEQAEASQHALRAAEPAPEAAAEQAGAAACAAAAAAVEADPVAAAMATAGALVSQLDGEEDVQAQQEPQQHMPAAGMASLGPEAAAATVEAAGGLRGVAHRRQSGSFPTAKRLGALQSSSGKHKKRAAESEVTSSRSQKKAAVGPAAPMEASRSPIATLLQQRAAQSGRTALPGSPYQGAYGFEEECSGGGAGAQPDGLANYAAAEAGEKAADFAGAAQAAAAAGADGEAAETAAAAAAPAEDDAAGDPATAANVPAPTTGLASAITLPLAAMEDATPAGAAGDSSMEEAPAWAGAEEQSSPGMSAAYSPGPSSNKVQQQELVEAAAAEAAAAAGVPQPHEQEEDPQPGSDMSPPESAVLDSQLMPQSPMEVAGPAAAAASGRHRPPAPGSQAPTPQTLQRRLSPTSAAWPGSKQQQAPQQQQQALLQQQQPQAGAQTPGGGARQAQAGAQTPAGAAQQQQQQQAGTPQIDSVLKHLLDGQEKQAPETNDRLRVARAVSSINTISVDSLTVIKSYHADAPYKFTVEAKRSPDGLVSKVDLPKALQRPHAEPLKRSGEWQFTSPRAMDPALVAQLQQQAGQLQAQLPAQTPARQTQQAQQSAQPPAQEGERQAPASASSLRSGVTLPLPAALQPAATGPPPETQRHNAAAAAAAQQRRRDSVDSALVLPQSVDHRQRLKEQQEQQGHLPVRSPAPRVSLFCASSCQPAQPSAVRPPLPAHPSGAEPAAAAGGTPQQQQQRQPQIELKLRSPARLPLCSSLLSPRAGVQAGQSQGHGQPPAGVQQLPQPSPSPVRRMGLISRVAPQLLASPALKQLAQASSVKALQLPQPMSLPPTQQVPMPVPPTQQVPMLQLPTQQVPLPVLPTQQEPMPQLPTQNAQILLPPTQHAQQQQAAMPPTQPAVQAVAPPTVDARRRQEAEAAVLALLEQARQEAAASSGSSNSNDPAQQEGCVLLYCTKTKASTGLPEIKLLLVQHTEPVVTSSPKRRVSHAGHAVVLARGPSTQQLVPSTGFEQLTVELGQHYHMVKEEGVRQLRYWASVGRVSHTILSALKGAIEELQHLSQAQLAQ